MHVPTGSYFLPCALDGSSGDITMGKPEKDYSEEEAQRRFEQALRGAKIAGHKPMKDVLRKKPKTQRKQGEKKPAK